MSKKHFIESYCRVTTDTIYVNGKKVFEAQDEDALAFLKAAYQWLEPGHPKFFKMDGLSKLAFIAAESLLSLLDEKEKDVALILANRASSLETDRKHQESIQDKENYYPSPAVFVYTLPNICIGEISIKHGFYSENAFFLTENFDASFMTMYANELLTLEKAERVLCGWVDFDSDTFEAFLYLTNTDGTLEHTAEEVSDLYKKR
jgi:hypothetical protein